jgi:hypothetical protein
LLEGVTLVWAVRSKTLVDGFTPFFDQILSQLNTSEMPGFFKVELYVSTASKAAAATPAAADAAGGASVAAADDHAVEDSVAAVVVEKGDAPADVEKGGMKLTVRTGGEGFVDGGGAGVSAAWSPYTTHYGRPDIVKVMEGLLGAEDASEAVGVMACASKVLLFEVQRQCVRRDVDLHAEEFAW